MFEMPRRIHERLDFKFAFPYGGPLFYSSQNEFQFIIAVAMAIM
jgi:hypothetical protein